jgi:transmembrane 9 superfamily protein 3
MTKLPKLVFAIVMPCTYLSPIYIFLHRMYGLFQTAFYFGHMALFSLGLGIMCGTIGYMGSNYFVRKIYSTVKID